VNKLLITIDGPAASGKGTISKLLAKKLGIFAFYTGNIYRAIALKIKLDKQDYNNIDEVLQAAQSINIDSLNHPKLNDEEIGQCASIISAYTLVRKEAYQFQRNIIDNLKSGAVIEGRDIGTVVCPEAKYKFYITADVEVRAKRRYEQLKNIGYEEVLNDLKMRDARDMNRVNAPLKPADDAIIIDNSLLTIEQTLDELIKMIKQN
jgi:CMP/dCMP kinase